MADCIHINDELSIAMDELTLTAIRAQGAGGQNVNKVASAIHLRFDVRSSSLPEPLKQALLGSRDQRINSEGVVVIKAQSHRTQEKNRKEAIERLSALIADAAQVRPERIATRPGKAAVKRRLEEKKKRGALKKLRSGPVE